MQKYKSNITTTSGAAVRGVPVLVIDKDGNNAALFLDRAGTVPAQNPLTTGPDGVFYFYAVNGRYSLRTTVDGVTITDDDVVLMMDPEEITVAGPIAEAVAAAQAAAIAAEFAVEASGIPDLVAAAQNAVVDSNNAVTQTNSAANNAAISKTGADSARDAAVAAKNAAEAALDSFDDRYLGAKAVAPTTDNDGGALLTGALYWDTVIGAMRAWSGSVWVTLPAATKASVGLENADNTSDAAKPISAATQTALNGKANTSHTHAVADVTGLQAALDAKVSKAGGTMTGPLTVPSLNGGQFSGLRNLLINGTMRTNQRGVPSLTNPASGAFLMDRWRLAYDGSGAARVWSYMDITPGDEVLTGGNIFYTRVEQTSSGAGATYLFLTQRIESARTLNGRKATVSFYARRVAGAGTTISGRFRQFFNGSTAVDTYFPATTVTGSWQRYSFTVDVPSVAGKTIGAGNYLEFSLALPFNQAFTIDITGVQVEEGTSASPFEDVSQGLELMLCQRYYERLASDILTGAQAGSQSIGSRVFYKVTKRTSGTVTANRNYTFNATPSSQVSAATTDGVMIFATSAAAGSLQVIDVVAVDAEL